MTLSDIEELERLEREATPGEWRADRNWYMVVGVGHDWDRTYPKGSGADFRVCHVMGPGERNAATGDHTFIPAIRNAAPELLDMARRALVVEGRIKELEAERDRLAGALDQKYRGEHAPICPRSEHSSAECLCPSNWTGCHRCRSMDAVMVEAERLVSLIEREATPRTGVWEASKTLSTMLDMVRRGR